MAMGQGTVMAAIRDTVMAATQDTVMAAMRLLTTAGTTPGTTVDTPQAMPRPIMVLGTGVLSVRHTPTAALAITVPIIAGIVSIGDC
jgi:hypothetical protein